MATGRSNKIVGQIGEYLASAEISRRCDCITTPFAGNVPGFDILATDDRCRTVPIQVKTSSTGRWQFNAVHYLRIELDDEDKSQTVLGHQPLDYPDLIHVFISLGDGEGTPDRFALCTTDEFQRIIKERYNFWLKKHGGRRPKKWDSTHCLVLMEHLKQYEDRWDLVRARFN
jgi:hypothetical protein